MHIFDIAPEIRLKIYSELLVLLEPIVFEADSGLLSRSKRDGLCPALLRVNKRIYSEANTLLYHNNRFRFPEVYFLASSGTAITHIAPFLHQIGSQASHIRHICIPFPDFAYPEPNRAELHEAQIKNIELVRETCTSLETLELLVSQYHEIYTLSDWSTAAEALQSLDTHFKNILSLKEVVVNFELYAEQNPSDDLTKKIYDYGWTVKTTEIPKEKWISSDDMVEFDNEEDCQAYDNDRFLFDEQKRRQEEEEEWLEEYYRRRDDPYWKNDSDYD